MILLYAALGFRMETLSDRVSAIRASSLKETVTLMKTVVSQSWDMVLQGSRWFKRSVVPKVITTGLYSFAPMLWFALGVMSRQGRSLLYRHHPPTAKEAMSPPLRAARRQAEYWKQRAKDYKRRYFWEKEKLLELT